MITRKRLAEYQPISADSHITEPPNCYIDFIDPKYRDIAPHIVRDIDKGDTFIINGIDQKVPMGLVAAAGRDPATIKIGETTFDSLHRGGWDPKARLGEQDVDGVAGEFIYPSIGMVLCGHPDPDYKHATMWAYNRWLETFVGEAPDRLFGVGQTAVRSVEEAIADAMKIKKMGFRGIMLPNEPATEFDYDDRRFDPLWEAVVQLGLPVSFHILTSGRKKNSDLSNLRQGGERGPAINLWCSVIRTVQDIIGMFIFGEVFDRHPNLRLVCVEGDAGWAPHFMFRMDHIYNRHRYWMKGAELKRLPSEYFKNNVFLTFQDDMVAYRLADLCGDKQLLWANDFPHSDSTWPISEEIVMAQAVGLSEEKLQRILRDNVVDLYGLDAFLPKSATLAA